MKQTSVIILFLSLLSFVSCNKTEHDNEEFLKGSFTFEKGMRFTTMKDAYIPVDSIYFTEEKTVEGDIVINHTQNVCTYIVYNLGVKTDSKTTINHLHINVKDDRITWMRSKDIQAGFYASYIEMEGDIKNRSFNFIETEKLTIGFGTGYSTDTCAIRLTGAFKARVIP